MQDEETLNERYLFACKQCYNLDPRVIVELKPPGKNGKVGCCGAYVFLHENITVSKNSEIFHEYQIVRPKLSTARANSYCRRRENCDKGDECIFVHTYQEMLVWKEDSRKRDRSTRKSLASVNPDLCNERLFHCPFCALNFKQNPEYVDHLDSKFHQTMRKYFESKNDTQWQYKPCILSEPGKCKSMSDPRIEKCDCCMAHSEKEYQEWKKRAAVYQGRDDYAKEEESYLTRIKRRVYNGDVKEMKESYDKQIERKDREAHWDCSLRLPDVLKLRKSLKKACIVGDYFKMKFPDGRTYHNQLKVSRVVGLFLNLKVKFTNPGVYEQYDAKLFLDLGDELRLPFVNFRVTVSDGMPAPYRDCFLSRIMIPYPRTASHESKYEKNLQKQLLKYPLLKPMSLTDVYIQSLTPDTYVESMHNFLYQEETARRAVLSNLNLECEITFSQHIFIGSGTLLGNKGNGSLYGSFESPTRLSTDSDEGFLARDSCGTVLIGSRERSLAYECKIEDWCDKDVYIHVPQRCVRDLELQNGTKLTLLVQYKLDRVKFCRMHYSLDCLRERVKLLCPTANSFAAIKEHDSSLGNLDRSQNAVMKKVLGTKLIDLKNPGKKCFPPLLVAGPFGTGKTHTIRNIIQQVFQTSGQESRILLCTHSNSLEKYNSSMSIVDTDYLTNCMTMAKSQPFFGFNEIMARFYEWYFVQQYKNLKPEISIDSASDLYLQDIHKSNWDMTNYQVLRIMYHNRKPNTVLVEDVRNFCLYTDDGSKFRYPTWDEILKYRIIITTFSTAPALGELGIGLRSSAFTHIFLDEASQAMEPEVIMPLTLACAENTRVIIAGDHKQINERTFLPKKVKIPTLLERMYHAYGDYNGLQSHKILLCNNYRTVDGLLQLISELFYKVGILKYSGDVQPIRGYHPVYFNHVEGTCESTSVGDYINVVEAQKVVDHVVKLTSTISEKEILVTSPYYSQVKLMRDLLRKQRLYSVIVYRAASVQALQYKVVILSCVLRRITCLQSEGENFGFLSDENLLNTVLTRAKSLVVAIGDASTLCSVGNCRLKWSVFLKHCEIFGTIQPQSITLKTIESHFLRADAIEFHPKSNGHVAVHGADEAYEWDDDEDAGNCEAANSESVNSDLSTGDVDDDLILYDMLEKMNGNSTVKQKGKEEEILSEIEHSDPNEPDFYSNLFADKEPFTPKHSLGELEHMLQKNPKRYRRCRIHFRKYCLADAHPIDEKGNDIHETAIILDGRDKVGRTFNNDEVLVKLEENVREQEASVARLGQVVGVFKRYRKIHQEHFLCKPWDSNISLMAPIERTCPFFTIRVPKNHRQSNPDKIPIYKVKTRKLYYTELELVSCERVDRNCLYAVRYLKWSEYCLSPLGFVEAVFNTDDLSVDDRLKLSLGIDNTERPSVTQQVKKVKIPDASVEDRVVRIFTIDPDGAIDLDDGLSLAVCFEHKDCYLLGVHITDVASLVEKNSPIDKMAHERKFTMYGIDSITHMLPEELTIEKCSLLKDQRRAAISTFFHSTKAAPHIGRKDRYVIPMKSMVMSTRQLSYREAEDILKESEKPKQQQSIKFQLKKIWKILWSWRVYRLGGAAFYSVCKKYSEIAGEGRSHMLIEEAMLAVNANAAAYLVDKGFNIELKVQAIPKHAEWNTWWERNEIAVTNSSYLTSTDKFILKQRGEERKFTRVPESMRDSAMPDPSPLPNSTSTSNRFSVLATLDSDEHSNDEIPNDDENGVVIYSFVWEDICQHMKNGDYDIILRTLALDYLHPSQVTALDALHEINEKARWTTNCRSNTLHSSLRLLLYTRCTSPIRRYPDIVIQRYLISAIEGNAPPKKIERANVEIDERILKLKQEMKIKRYANILKEQPVCVVVSLAMVTEAGLRLSFSSGQEIMLLRMKSLDFGHLMLDLQTKDFLEDFGNERRNKNDDLILEKMDAVWKFRYYDYQKDMAEISTVQRVEGDIDITKTVMIPKKQLQKLVTLMSHPPGFNVTKNIRKNYEKNVKRAISRFAPIEQHQSVVDKMVGKTSNAPRSIFHLREIKKSLSSGSVIQVQLSGSSGYRDILEPCIQLFILAKDLSICVQHNKDAVLMFAADAEKMIIDHASQSLEEYARKWEPLIRLDGSYNAVTDGNSIFINNVKISWEEDLEFDEHRIYLNRQYCRERYIDFHVGDLLCLRLRGVRNNSDSVELNACSTYTVVFHGHVSSVLGDKYPTSELIEVKFRLFDQHFPNASIISDANNRWTLEILKLSFMHRHFRSTLWKLQSSNNMLITKIVLRSLDEDENEYILPHSTLRLLSSRTLDGFPYPLNDEQQNQKIKCLTQKFTLVQGPPGTGKSYMGAQIAACFSILNKASNSESPQKVLYCGPSNKAVDVAAAFLKEADDVKVVRMYSKGLEEKIYPNPIKPPSTNQSPGEESKMPDEKLDNISLHEIIRNAKSEWVEKINRFDERVKDVGEKFTRDEVDEYQDAVKKAKMKVLKEADVIVCTCSLSAQLGELKEMKEALQFAQCIIDECGMCSEPETMIPIVTSNPDQVVLIGDHKQLQPVVKCNRAQRLGLGDSLFWQYRHMAEMLTVQYRMNHEIMETPSKLFYNGKLVADDSINMREFVKYFPHIDSNNIFWNVVGKEREQKFRSVRGGRRSKYNEMEANKVVELLEYLMNNSDLDVKDIMVLSPYTAQCTRIQSSLRKNHNRLLRKVHVGSVVTSQGSEAKFVILSTVRSMDLLDIRDQPSKLWQKQHLGFLTDPHQVNVALTRAQLGLCIIGNKELLQTCHVWREIIQSYHARGAVHDGKHIIIDCLGIGNSSSSDESDCYEHGRSSGAYSLDDSDSQSEDETTSGSESDYEGERI